MEIYVVGVERILQQEVILLGGQALAHTVVDLGHQLRVLERNVLTFSRPWPSCSPS